MTETQHGWKQRVKQGVPVMQVMQEFSAYHMDHGTWSAAAGSKTFRWLMAKRLAGKVLPHNASFKRLP